MADSIRSARAAVAQAKQTDAALQLKGRAAQNIGRSLGQMALDDDQPQPNLNDVSSVMIRLVALVGDMMALSSEVVEACEGALTTSHE